MLGAVAQGAVGVVLLASAAVKIRRPDALREALEAIGVDSVLQRPMMLAVAIIEGAVGVALLVVPGRIAGSLAIGVIVVYSAVLVFLHRAAPAARCGCLGDELHGSGQAPGLVRNAALLTLLSTSVIAGPGSDGVASTGVAIELALLIVLISEALPLISGLRGLSASYMPGKGGRHG